MKKYILKPAVWIIPILLLVTGIGYATKDKKPKPIEIKTHSVPHIQVTDQRTMIVRPAEMVPGTPQDTIVGVYTDWEDFSVGGIVCSSATYSSAGSFGDVSAGECSTATYGVTQGVAIIVEELCCVVPGDANNDDNANVGDAVYLISYVFKSGPAPPCLNEGDANFDCDVNVGDAVYMISYVFKGGPAPRCGCAE